MEEVFCKNQNFFYDRSQQPQGKEDQGGQAEEQMGEKGGAGPSRPPQEQEVQGRAQGQDQGHEQAKAAVSHGDAQEEEQQGGQEAEQQVQGQPELLQPQLPAQSGQQVVDKAESGAAGQGDQRLQPLPAGVETHQPRSLPNQPRRPGAFSA